MTKKNLSLVSPVIMLMLMTYLSFIDRFAFNFIPGNDQHYELLALSSLLLIGYVLSTSTNLLALSGRIIFCSLMLTVCCLDSSNEYLNTVSTLLVLSILICGASIGPLLLTFFYGNLLFLLIQSSLSFYQYLQGDPMTGSFTNTGVLANYLSTAIPTLFFVFGLAHSAKKKILPFLGLVLFSMVLFIVVKNQSRTALMSLALTAAVAFFSFVRNRYKNPGRRMAAKFKVIYCLAAALCFFAVVVYSSSIKQTSAAGRVLLNRIAIRHIGDHLWLGTGLGKFTWYYPQWQSDYFLHFPGDPLRLSAGESYIIFNEYLQLLETLGLRGMILFLGILGWFFTTRSLQLHQELSAIKLTCLAILTCGTTFYPFHVNAILFSFFLCIGLAFSLDERKAYHEIMAWFNRLLQKINPKLTVTALITSLLGFVFCIPGILRRQSAVAAWHHSKEINRAYTVQKSDYERLYPILKHDGKFLSDYGIFLLEDSLETLKAVQLLSAANEQFISRETVMALGNAYWKQKDLNKAIYCFDWMKNYIPYTFEPKFNLMKLYLESGCYSKARQMADSIINTPPKIPSDKVNYIKQETAKLIAL